MTVENNYTIAIITPGDCLQHVFQSRRSKTKPMAPCARDFSRALSKLLVIARNFYWFIPLFACVVIGLRNYFVSVFFF